MNVYTVLGLHKTAMVLKFYEPIVLFTQNFYPMHTYKGNEIMDQF